MGKRELVALLNLSSWCLVVVGRLFLAVPRGCLRFVIVVFPDHTHFLYLMSPAILYCLNYLSTQVTPWFCLKLRYHGNYSCVLHIQLNHVHYVIVVFYPLTNFQGWIYLKQFNLIRNPEYYCIYVKILLS